MKAPDLASVDDAGVHPWTGATDALKAAAAHAQLKFAVADLGRAKDRATLFAGLDRRSSCRSISATISTRWPTCSRTATGGQDTAASSCSRTPPPTARTIQRLGDARGHARGSSGVLERAAQGVLDVRRLTAAAGTACDMAYKQPVSVLVLVYTTDRRVLLHRARRFSGHWQSVTGSQEPGETLAATADARAAEETGIDARALRRADGLAMSNVYEIFPQWRHRYAPGITHNTEHVFGLEVPAPGARDARPAGAPAPRVAALARRRREVFFVVEPRRHRSAGAPRSRRKDIVMIKTSTFRPARNRGHLRSLRWSSRPRSPRNRLRTSLPAAGRHAFRVGHGERPQRPHAGVDARGGRQRRSGGAAGVVNTRMAKALALAKAAKGVEASTSGYSSHQITDKNQPSRWRVAQTLKLEGGDFAAMSALITQLQADGGLVVDGTQFSVSDASRRKAEDG